MRTSKSFAELAMALVFLVAVPGSAPAQNNGGMADFFPDWFDRVTATQAEQPHWITPVYTVTPRLEEELRYDITQQSTSGGNNVDNYGVSKGLELIPTEHIEFIFSIPPYFTHTNPSIHDGFGDVSFLMKYRLLASNEEHHNYILTAFLGATVPTGSYKNGSTDASVTPTIAGGKGFGNFDFQSTLGVAIPTGDMDKIGSPVLFNTTFQYRVLKKIWPEVEVNSIFWSNGEHAGKKQTFLSPGLVLGRFHLWHRVGFTIGGGVQIAATQYYTSNHNYTLSVRFPF